MKPILAVILATFTFAPVQDDAMDDLFRRLNSESFTEQGKAAAELEGLGRAVVARLKKTQKESADARVRTWCGWILERIETRDAGIKALIGKLGSADDEVKEAAEQELKKIGAPAVPYLDEARKSGDKNLKRRADRLLLEIGGGSDGGGTAGQYGGRFGGRENLAARGGGTRATESAVLAGLKWLARHQGADGSWSAAEFSKQCAAAKCGGPGDSDHDVGNTALALLAFLGAGYSHLSKDEYPDPAFPGRTLKFGEVVKNGLKWLLSKQDAEGCVGPRGSKYVVHHATAAAALAEAYGMSNTAIFKGPAQLAADFLVAAQNPGKGWRFTKQSGDNDTSVTGWVVLALKSAERSELTVPAAAFEGALAWFNEVTDSTVYHRVGYNSKNSGKVFVPGKNENFQHHETMTALAAACRIFISGNRKDPALEGVALLTKDLPEWKADAIDYTYWHHASTALFQYDGPDGPYWKKWQEPLKRALVPTQQTAKDGCASGSWDPDVDRWGFEGGRVWAVAINTLTLEIYYRYAIVK